LWLPFSFGADDVAKGLANADLLTGDNIKFEILWRLEEQNYGAAHIELAHQIPLAKLLGRFC